MFKPSFVQFKTSDELLLPGLLFKSGNSKRAVIYLHGNGSSSVFYENNFNWQNELVNKEIDVLMFNNRGAHIIKKFSKYIAGEKVRVSYGMSYEIIKDCIIDIDAAINLLCNLGYNQFYLIGASTGANKICVYNHYKKNNRILKYILLGPGDDTGIYYYLLGKQKFTKILKTSRDKIKNRQGDEIIKDLIPEPVITYKSFYDMCNPDGDYNCFPFWEVISNAKLSQKPLFGYYREIKKPAQVIFGSNDEFCWNDVAGCVTILQKYQPGFTYRIINGANHGFDGYEKQLGKLMADFID